MSEITAFITKSEMEEILSHLIMKYDAVFTAQSGTNDKFITHNEIAKLLYDRHFIQSPHWECTPYKIKTIGNRCNLDLRVGGPYLDFIPSKIITKDGNNWMIPGSFSNFAFYYSGKDQNIEVPRPVALNNMFNFVKRKIIGISVKTVCAGEGFEGPRATSGAVAYYKDGGWLRIGKNRFIPK